MSDLTKEELHSIWLDLQDDPEVCRLLSEHEERGKRVAELERQRAHDREFTQHEFKMADTRTAAAEALAEERGATLEAVRAAWRRYDNDVTSLRQLDL